MKNTWILLFVWIILFVGTNYIYVEKHESAHQQISKNFGCTESEKSNYVFKGRHKCLERSYFDSESYLRERTLQAQTEMVGYHVEVMMWVFYSLGLLGILIYGTEE